MAHILREAAQSTSQRSYSDSAALMGSPRPRIPMKDRYNEMIEDAKKRTADSVTASVTAELASEIADITLICNICLDRMTADPVRFNCGHSFCLACSTEWFKRQQFESKLCPSCRSNVTDVKRNHEAVKILDQLLPKMTEDARQEVMLSRDQKKEDTRVHLATGYDLLKYGPALRPPHRDEIRDEPRGSENPDIQRVRMNLRRVLAPLEVYNVSSETFTRSTAAGTSSSILSSSQSVPAHTTESVPAVTPESVSVADPASVPATAPESAPASRILRRNAPHSGVRFDPTRRSQRQNAAARRMASRPVWRP